VTCYAAPGRNKGHADTVTASRQMAAGTGSDTDGTTNSGRHPPRECRYDHKAEHNKAVSMPR